MSEPKENLRILVCGDRNWTSTMAVARELRKYGRDSVVITGGASGADSIAADTARRLYMTTIIYPARWDDFGKSAGTVRNQKMLDEGKPDIVLAFHEDLAKSKGTRHMVEIARRAHIPVVLFTE